MGDIKKMGILERMALNVLLRKNYKIQDKIIYDEKAIPAGKELGQVEARNLLLAQQVKALQSKKKEQPQTMEDVWRQIRKELVRIPAYDGARLVGSDGNPLSAIVVEMYLDGRTGRYWIGAKSGNKMTILGPHRWDEMIQVDKDNNSHSLFINFVRDASGKIVFMPEQEYRPMYNPEAVYLDPSMEKIDVNKVVDNLDAIEEEKKMASELSIETQSRLNDLERDMMAKLSSLSSQIKQMESALEPKPQKTEKQQKQKKPEKTNETPAGKGEGDVI